MALTYQVDSLDGVDEAVKALYVADGEKFKLDVEGVIATSEYDSKITEANGKLKEVRKKSDEYIKKLKGFGENTPESIEELLQKSSELQILADQNKGTSEDTEAKLKANKEYYDSKLGDANTKHAEKVLELQNAINAKEAIILDSKLEKEIIDNVKETAKTESLIDVISLMKGMIEYNAEAEVFESKGTGLSIEELSKQFFKERPYLVKESTSGGSQGNLNKGALDDPFKEGDSYSRTKQAQMFRENPELAKKLQEQAQKLQK